MNNISLILSAVLMIVSFCGSTIPESVQSLPGAETLAAESVSDIAKDADALTLIPPAPADLEQEPEASPPPSPAMEQSSIFDIMDREPSPSPAYQVDLASFYLEEMCLAAAEGNVKAGRTAEENRSAAIDAVSSEAEKISFDDLYLLARVIYSEAGSDWLSEDFRLCVGEVVLNRIASPEFPDTMHDVVYQKGQYSGVNTVKFANLKPGEDCVNAALKLLQGERLMVPSVVYQSDNIQGELFSMYADIRLGNTYFCLSPNQELYPID